MVQYYLVLPEAVSLRVRKYTRFDFNKPIFKFFSCVWINQLRLAKYESVNILENLFKKDTQIVSRKIKWDNIWEGL